MAGYGVSNAANTDAGSPFLVEKPVKRIGLVIANWNYSDGLLESTKLDQTAVKEQLEGLGFTIHVASNFRTQEELVDEYLNPLLRDVKAGDFVIIYYSGHGFSWSGENYMVPVGLPNEIGQGKFFDYFVSAEEIQRQTASHLAGVSIVIFDACRSFTPPTILREDGTVEDIAKGSIQPRIRLATNFVIGYAAEPGSTAIARAGMRSLFTDAIVEQLTAGTNEFDQFQRFVINQVLNKSNEKQLPWFAESATAVIRFKETQQSRDEDHSAWMDTLDRGTLEAVRTYLRAYPTSRYAAAARDWMRQNANGKVLATTFIPPAVIAEAWKRSPETQISAYPDVNGYFQIAKSDRQTVAIQNASALALNGGPTFDAASIARYLSSTSTLVTSKSIAVRLSPSATSKIAFYLPKDAPIALSGAVTGSDGATWLQANLPSLDGRAFIAAPPSKKIRGNSIGTPMTEGLIRASQNVLSSHIEDSDVYKILAGLGERRRAISWVSIESGKASCEDVDPRCQAERDVRTIRDLHVERLLVDSGISRSRITSLSDVPDVAVDQIRIRLFSIGGSNEK